MSMVIGTNVASLTAQRHLASSRLDMEASMERLSSGSKINSAMDDAAGLSISNRMEAQVQGFGQAMNNANDGISMVQAAEGGLEQTTDILLRMRELAVQSSSGTYSADDRANINAEFTALTAEVTRISAQTKFNGTSVLGAASTVEFQVGAAVNDQISVSLLAMDAGSIGSTATATNETAGLGAYAAGATSQVHTYAAIVGVGETATFSINGNEYSQDYVESGDTAGADALDSKATMLALGQKVAAGESNISAAAVHATNGLELTFTVTAGTEAGQLKNITEGGVAADNVLTAAKAEAAIASIDAAIKDVTDYRGQLGAIGNRLSHTVENLMTRSENTSSAQSRIQDTDFAVESANLAKAQVLQQAGTAMLAQANQSGQAVLSLLK
jgi:flagellin